MKQFLTAACIVAVTVGLAAAPGPTFQLPAFAGWQVGASAIFSKTPWGLSQSRVAAMNEFGLQQVEQARYQRGDRTISVRGMLFRDASGAYGAFTEMLPADAQSFDAGSADAEAVDSGNEILMTRGSWLLRVDLDTITAMTASDMRGLAAALPMRGGADDQWPTIQLYLPQAHELANSERYAEGPAAFAAACDWLPAAAVGFNQGAEAALGGYALADTDETTPAPPAQMAIVAYPTPQIARSRFDSLTKLSKAAPFLIRRSGPILVLLHGAAGQGAQQLLQSVNYDAVVTMTQPTPMGIEGLPGLILAIFVLIGLLMAVAVVVGILTGGLPAMLRRMFPNRFKDPAEDKDLILLNLK